MPRLAELQARGAPDSLLAAVKVFLMADAQDLNQDGEDAEMKDESREERKSDAPATLASQIEQSLTRAMQLLLGASARGKSPLASKCLLPDCLPLRQCRERTT